MNDGQCCMLHCDCLKDRPILKDNRKAMIASGEIVRKDRNPRNRCLAFKRCPLPWIAMVMAGHEKECIISEQVFRLLGHSPSHSLANTPRAVHIYTGVYIDR